WWEHGLFFKKNKQTMLRTWSKFVKKLSNHGQNMVIFLSIMVRAWSFSAKNTFHHVLNMVILV
ncbi:hypothetical protein, partial [Enterococcus faecalis]|uniref:hypothetical protein n=1 Tax=Enterococcus faecalis TaxID=1351 RepID=UPI001A934BDC